MRSYGPASEVGSRLSVALFDALGRAVNTGLFPPTFDFAAAMAWCEQYIDTEICPDEHTDAPVRCARDAVRAYAKERGWL